MHCDIPLSLSRPLCPGNHLPNTRLDGGLCPAAIRCRATARAVDPDPRSFSFYDVGAAAWHAHAGTYNLMLGDSAANIQQKIALQLPRPIITSVSD